MMMNDWKKSAFIAVRRGLLLLLYVGFVLAGASVVRGDANYDIPDALADHGTVTTMLTTVEAVGFSVRVGSQEGSALYR